VAIRRDAPKVAKTQQVPQKVPAAPDQAVALRGLTDLIDRALVDGNFSQSESRKLDQALAASPGLREQVAAHLKAALEKRNADGAPISISEMALSQVSRSLGVDFKELFFRRQQASHAVDHEVAGGLEKTAKTISDEHSAEKHKAASETRLQNQKAILDGKRGVVDRPIGGVKGAAYDAGLAVIDSAEKRLDAALPEEAKAAKDAVREPIVRTSSAVVHEVMKNPETMKSLGDVAGAFGTPGFKDALGNAATHLGGDIDAVLNVTAVNTEAVEAFASGAKTGVEKVVALSKGTSLEASVAKHAAKASEGITSVAGKLTQGAKVAEGAADAAKVAGTAATAGKAAQAAGTAAKTAQLAGSAAAETAQVAGAAGAAGKVAGQSVPVVGQALGVVMCTLSAAEFVGDCAHKPRDWKRIGASFLNTVGQVTGIFIPFVGAVSTGAKFAADAAMNAHDKKQGKEPHHGLNLGEITPHVTSATAVASEFLEGMGHGEAGTKIRAYSQKLEVLGQKGLTTSELAQLAPAEREALMQTLAACQGQAEKLAEEEKGTPREATARLMGEAFRGLMSAFTKAKNVDLAENPDAERKKAVGQAMESVGKAAAAKAILDEAEKQAS
jgi:hypothetical protein